MGELSYTVSCLPLAGAGNCMAGAVVRQRGYASTLSSGSGGLGGPPGCSCPPRPQPGQESQATGVEKTKVKVHSTSASAADGAPLATRASPGSRSTTGRRRSWSYSWSSGVRPRARWKVLCMQLRFLQQGTFVTPFPAPQVMYWRSGEMCRIAGEGRHGPPASTPGAN